MTYILGYALITSFDKLLVVNTLLSGLLMTAND